MIAVVIASTIFAGTGCHVPIAGRVVVAHNYAANNYVAPTYATNQYYTASALAYKVEDPDHAALVRQNEKLTDALIDHAKANRDRADRNEAALGKPSDGAGSPDVPKLRAEAKNDAPAILKAVCAKCHSGDKAQGGFTLSLAPDGKASLEMRSLIYDVVSQEEMPPKSAKPLTAEEKQAIGEWAAASREELKAALKVAKK